MSKKMKAETKRRLSKVYAGKSHREVVEDVVTEYVRADRDLEAALAAYLTARQHVELLATTMPKRPLQNDSHYLKVRHRINKARAVPELGFTSIVVSRRNPTGDYQRESTRGLSDKVEFRQQHMRDFFGDL